MQREKHTPAQKKIAVATFIILLVFLVAWLFLYLPSGNRLDALKAQLELTQRQIIEIEAILGEDTSIEKGINSLRARHGELADNFPAEEEGVLEFFSDTAKRLNIRLESLKSEPVRPLLIDKQKVEIEGKSCQQVYVLVEMRCSYEEFVKYTEELRASLPVLITIEKLGIARVKGDSGQLDIEVGLNLYLLPKG